MSARVVGVDAMLGSALSLSRLAMLGSPDPLDSAAHPWAVQLRPLVVDVQPLQGKGEDPGREDFFVVGANRFRLVFDGIEQQSKNDYGRAITQCVKRQQLSTAVIEDAQ